MEASSDIWTLIADLADWPTACAIRLLQRNTISANTVRAAALRQRACDRRLVDYMTRRCDPAVELDADIVRRRICACAIGWRTCIHAFTRDGMHYFRDEVRTRAQARRSVQLDPRDGQPIAGEVVLLVRQPSGEDRLVRITRHPGVWHDTMIAVDRLAALQRVGWKASSSAPIAKRPSDDSSSSAGDGCLCLWGAAADGCELFSTRSAAARSVRRG